MLHRQNVCAELEIASSAGAAQLRMSNGLQAKRLLAGWHFQSHPEMFAHHLSMYIPIFCSGTSTVVQ